MESKIALVEENGMENNNTTSNIEEETEMNTEAKAINAKSETETEATNWETVIDESIEWSLAEILKTDGLKDELDKEDIEKLKKGVWDGAVKGIVMQIVTAGDLKEIDPDTGEEYTTELDEQIVSDLVYRQVDLRFDAVYDTLESTIKWKAKAEARRKKETAYIFMDDHDELGIVDDPSVKTKRDMVSYMLPLNNVTIDELLGIKRMFEPDSTVAEVVEKALILYRLKIHEARRQGVSGQNWIYRI